MTSVMTEFKTASGSHIVRKDASNGRWALFCLIDGAEWRIRPIDEYEQDLIEGALAAASSSAVPANTPI